MSLRFSIAVAVLSAAVAYALFKIYQARPGGGTRWGRAELTEEQRLHGLLGSIPAGRVMTLASLTEHSGGGQNAKQIAQAVRALANQDSIPWWRVVRQSGKSGQVMPASAAGKKQRQLLGEEGVRVKDGGFALAEYEWTPGA